MIAGRNGVVNQLDFESLGRLPRCAYFSRCLPPMVKAGRFRQMPAPPYPRTNPQTGVVGCIDLGPRTIYPRVVGQGAQSPYVNGPPGLGWLDFREGGWTYTRAWLTDTLTLSRLVKLRVSGRVRWLTNFACRS